MANESPSDILYKVAVQSRIPTMVVGASGTGKTATIKQLAQDMDYEVIILLGSQLDPTDITGLPQGQVLGKTANGSEVHGTVMLATEWQVRILQKKKVILFLDEYSSVPAATRAGMLTLIQDRMFPNGRYMPDETVVIGAMNPPEEAANGEELELPTKNRFFFMPWNPPASEWYQGMLNAWGRDVSDSEKQWRKKIVGFVKDNPQFLHKQPESGSAQFNNSFPDGMTDPSEMEVFGSAWPSRRSWDNLAQALPQADDSVYAQDVITQGLVGFEASGQFRDWLRKHDVLNPSDVLADPDSVNWKKLSLDDSNLVLREIVGMVNQDNVHQVITVFETIAKSGKANVAASFINDLNKKLSAFTSDPDTKKRAFNMLSQYQNIGERAQ